MYSPAYMERIPSKRGKALYVIACGEDMTKLEIKEGASLSMSTVIAAVEELAAEGLVTAESYKVRQGGKPHFAINVSPNRCVYGISYRAGKLHAVALDLKGGRIKEDCLAVGEEIAPLEAVLSLSSRLRKDAPPPLAIALALNCAEQERVVAALGREQGAEVLSIGNTAALAYRALWRGSPSPLAVIGIGSRIKCAYLGKEGCRTADLSALTLAPVFSRGEGCASVLSSARVEETLRLRDYGGTFFAEGRLRESRDLADYSRLLVRGIKGVAETVYAFYEPREIRLFGEYLSEGFFERIRVACPTIPLVLEEAEAVDFAEGAGIAALTERVFI